MKFDLIKNLESGVRLGKLATAHGVIDTPFFMPVGTVGSVKGVSPDELKELGAQIVLSNTYHLYLRPGEKLIKKMGGLHEFMRWDGPILTDSGGYQVFSLGERKNNYQLPITNSQLNSKYQTKININSNLTIKQFNNKSLVKVTQDGVEFTSHLDGSKHFFTPEKVIDIQFDLGVDILMPLDVCPSGKASKEEIKEAVELTIEWAKRAKKHFDKKIAKLLNCSIVNVQKDGENRNNNLTIKQFNNNQQPPALFGIVQGGLNPKLREYCAKELIKLNFDGYAVGGLAVDHETRDMWHTVQLMGEILPVDKPRYLMGVGTPNDIYQAIRLGMDMFDCVLPTRLARHGSVFVHKNGISKSKFPIFNEISNIKSQNINSNLTIEQFNNNHELINLLNSKYRTDSKVIEEGCECPACKGGFSRAYISHLIRSNEILGMRLATLHNLKKYLDLVKNTN